MFPLVAVPASSHGSSWYTGETTNVLFRPEWSCSGRRSGTSQISSPVAWLSLVSKKKKKGCEVAQINDNNSEDLSYSVWTTWCTDPQCKGNNYWWTKQIFSHVRVSGSLEFVSCIFLFRVSISSNPKSPLAPTTLPAPSICVLISRGRVKY